MPTYTANGDCDYGSDVTHSPGAIHRLPTGGGAGINLCKRHWEAEMRWRRARNLQLDPRVRYPIIAWPRGQSRRRRATTRRETGNHSHPTHPYSHPRATKHRRR